MSETIAIILESPNKIKKIQSILFNIKDKKYVILASCGHFRELSNNYDGMGFCIKDDKVIVEYVEDIKKKSIISNIKTRCKSIKTIYLATDPDREGEAIAWHITELLGKRKEYYRVKFHSITKGDVLKALNNPTKLDMNLVLAQQTRKIIDKWIGFRVSPLCWKEISKLAKSAGRVQSPTLKIIVNREKEILEFKSEEYYSILGNFQFKNSIITELKEVPLKQYLDIPKPIYFYKEDDAMKVIDDIFSKTKKNKWNFRYKETTSNSNPQPPYTTLTILQDCNTILKIKPEVTMLILQKMYESGWITYHRTDSVVLSPEGLFETRKAIEEIDKELLTEKPRNYTNKSLNAQEAHEPIRPTHFEIIDLENYLSVNDGSEEIDKSKLDPRIFKVYSMIYLRTLASQCVPLVNSIYNLEFLLSNTNIEFSKTYSFLKNLGWKKLYLNKRINKFYNKNLEELEKVPEWILKLKNEELSNILLHEFELDTHHTTPPPYYTSSSIIKELETLGIGRPSTYANIISKLFDNNYIYDSKDKYIHPTPLGITLIEFLDSKFKNHFMNLEYTRKMENLLDQIAEGKSKWTNDIIVFIKEFSSI